MRDDKQPEHLEGTVEDVIFYNEDSGFTVLAVSVEDELITLVGKTSGVAEGEEITAEVFEAHADEIFDEAENRLHAQKAVMVKLMGDT